MAVVAALAGLAGLWQQRQQPTSPTATPGVPPGQLNRGDFRAPEAPILIAVFTSSTCSSCDAVWAELSGYESSTVAAQNVEVSAEPTLHERYHIESVPTAVIVDATGETQAAFVGPLGADHRAVLREITSVER